MIVLLQPPFFRHVGSHNDRPNLNLAYASSFLEDAGIEHVLVNADWAGTPKHVPWSRLFKNEDLWDAAVDGRSPLYETALEQVMRYRPDTVIVAAGDDVVPTKNTGSPYTAALMAQLLRRHTDAKLIGVGPAFTKPEAQQVFGADFDVLFPSMMNKSIVDVVLGEMPTVMTGTPLGSVPQFVYTTPACTTDYVMSTFGCVYECSFCYAPVVAGRQMMFQPTDLFVSDLRRRSMTLGTRRLYIADMIFPINVRRMNVLADELEKDQFELSCECRVDLVTPAVVDVLQRMGMKTVKLGIESMTSEALKQMHKNTTLHQIRQAVTLLKDAGMKVVGYLIFGAFYENAQMMMETIELARGLELDYYVVNVESYGTLNWESNRWDAHFSLRQARSVGVPDEVIAAALELQEGHVNPTVEAL